MTLARDYFLPHAQAAFALMGADATVENARHVWATIARQSESVEWSESASPPVSRRDIHQWNRRRFPNVEELDPVLALLVDRYYLRPAGATGQPGRGHVSPRYEVNPLALATVSDEDPRTHCTQRTHSDPESAPSEYSEDSESAPRSRKGMEAALLIRATTTTRTPSGRPTDDAGGARRPTRLTSAPVDGGAVGGYHRPHADPFSLIRSGVRG